MDSWGREDNIEEIAMNKTMTIARMTKTILNFLSRKGVLAGAAGAEI